MEDWRVLVYGKPSTDIIIFFSGEIPYSGGEADLGIVSKIFVSQFETLPYQLKMNKLQINVKINILSWC